MKLYVDIGNTAVKWATDETLQSEEVEHCLSEPSFETLLKAWERIERPVGVFISSVLSEDKQAVIEDWSERQWGIKPYWAESKSVQLGVKNAYRKPSQLGVDRWLALLAAHSLYQSALLVVDCGSATTLDGMDASGNHLGGVILPGLWLFPHCLMKHTEIPAFNNSETIDYFATDTATGINSGAILATISSVERMAEMIQKAHQSPCVCLVTGGGAEALTRYLTIEHRLAPNLVLHGLALVAAKVEV